MLQRLTLPEIAKHAAIIRVSGNGTGVGGLRREKGALRSESTLPDDASLAIGSLLSQVFHRNPSFRTVIVADLDKQAGFAAGWCQFGIGA